MFSSRCLSVFFSRVSQDNLALYIFPQRGLTFQWVRNYLKSKKLAYINHFQSMQGPVSFCCIISQRKFIKIKREKILLGLLLFLGVIVCCFVQMAKLFIYEQRFLRALYWCSQTAGKFCIRWELISEKMRSFIALVTNVANRRENAKFSVLCGFIARGKRASNKITVFQPDTRNAENATKI